MPGTEQHAPPRAPEAASDQPTAETAPDTSGVVGTRPVAPTGIEPPTGPAPSGDDPLVRVCPICSVQDRTTGEFCPHCGASYTRRRRRLGKRAKIIGAVVRAALLAGGGATGVILKRNHDHSVAAAKSASG
jgi:hypothetical protein